MSSSRSNCLRLAALAVVLLLPTTLPAVEPTPTPASTSTPRPTPKPRTPESAVTPVNRNPGRHTQFLKRIQQGPADLLFLGDSITDFWPRKGPDTWAKYAPYRPADFGVSGEDTEDVLWRIENGELDGIHPKVAVVMIGTNNIGHFGDEQPAWVVAGIRKIVDDIHAKLPDTKVLLLGVFPRDMKASDRRKRVEAVNEQIAKFDDGNKTRYLDIGHVFLDAKGEIPHDAMPDRLHPSAQGYGLWYDAMQPTLEEMMK